MTKMSEAATPKLTHTESAAPATPAAGTVVTYAKTDGLMYQKDDAGTETLMAGGSSGAVATDAIWDAKGDIAGGTGANTAAKLTVGANDTVLTADSAEATGMKWAAAGGSHYTKGTTFPGGPSTNDEYYRTDVRGGMLFFYDGTRWVSDQIFSASFLAQGVIVDTYSVMGLPTDYQLYLEKWHISVNVSGSATWVATLDKVGWDVTITNIDSQSTAAQTANRYYGYTKTLGTVVDGTGANSGANVHAIWVFWDEQSGTATLFGGVTLEYRIIAT